MNKYILNRLGEPEPCEDMFHWAQWFESHDRTLARTELPGVAVSTVFLGLDHRFSFEGEGPPILWETMIFADDTSTAHEFDQDQLRYSSREAALAGHRAMVARLSVN